MCGIAGVVVNQARSHDAGKLARSIRSLSHRGPDDSGWLVYSRAAGVRFGRGDFEEGDAEAVLLHWRLSILDLSSAGWQPMGSPDGRYFIVFNGEIYNYIELREQLRGLGYTFQSHSDTEVLLAAYREWGAQAFPRLVGMFALAVLDTHERRLMLARDFFGIKPLYFARCHDGFAFGSEIKALLRLPGVQARVNPQRLYDYLRFGLTDHEGETLFADISQLPPAHYLELPLDGDAHPGPMCYWKLSRERAADLSFDEAAGKLRELFLENVGLHLRSDIPVGAALSGGIDSSAVVASMRWLQPNAELHTFTYVADDPFLNEAAWARTLGEAAGVVAHEIQPNAGELASDLDELIRLQDEPFGSTSIYAQHRVFRLAQETGIRVMLDGQGADELLGGYRPYLSSRLASLLRQGRWPEAFAFLTRAGGSSGRGKVALLARAGAKSVPTPLQTLAQRLTTRVRLPRWLNERWFTQRGVRFEDPLFRTGKHVLNEKLRQSVMKTSLPMLLRYEDRNSMAYSIESRVPFLTPKLANFVLSLPEEYLISSDGTTKAVFRQAMRGIVPDVILDRKDKIGFATPEATWLTSLRPWVETVLQSTAAQELPALNPEVVAREWSALVQKKRTRDSRIWRWINLIRWADLWQADFR